MNKFRLIWEEIKKILFSYRIIFLIAVLTVHIIGMYSDYNDWISSTLAREQMQNGIVTNGPIYNHGIHLIFKKITGDYGAIFLYGFCILALVSPIFSDEYKHNMVPTITATKKGRKQILSAKILSIYICLFFWVSFIFIVSSIIYLRSFNCIGLLDKPLVRIDGFTNTIFNVSLWQGLVLSYLFILVGCFSLAALFALISRMSTNTLTSMIGGFLLLVSPTFISETSVLYKLCRFMPVIGMQAAENFLSSSSFEFCGVVIHYMYLSQFVSIFIGCLAIRFIVGKKAWGLQS